MLAAPQPRRARSTSAFWALAFRPHCATATPQRTRRANSIQVSKPRPERKEAAYFENDELPRLFAELAAGLYRTVCLVALKTGMRQGELLGLCWGDLDLQEAVIRVRRSYTSGTLGTPKNHERRDVDLTSEVVELLGSWWGECGGPAEETLVFPGATKSGYVSSSSLLGELYGAMERAGVPRVGPTGEKRTFHSFRHTYAKRALETGAQITWLSRHLGHSSLAVTTDDLRALRTRGTQASGGKDGGSVPRLNTRRPGIVRL